MPIVCSSAGKYPHSWGACAFYALYILFSSFQFNSFQFYSIQRDENYKTLRMKTNDNEKNENYRKLRNITKNYEILRKKKKYFNKKSR